MFRYTEECKIWGEIGVEKVNTSGVIMFPGCMCIFVRANYVFVYIKKVKCMYEDTGRQKNVQGVFLSHYTDNKNEDLSRLTANNNNYI